jgi:5'-methylthioadenosine phosphorylase
MVKNAEMAQVGVIGGSGMYDIDGIEDVKELAIKTPFGDPSDTIIVGSLSGVRCAFLPRHGRGHTILPSEVNSRANMYALKSLGVQQVVSVSACGSLKEEVKPRDFLIPDQIYDATKGRPSTFFGGGIVAHVGFAEPFCGGMRDVIHQGVATQGITHHFGGTYVCMEGPAFSTKAESEFNRKQGFSVIGMTAIPEAKLAREAEMCYATIALVTDYDVWKDGEEVSVEAIIAHMQANVANSKRLLKHILPKLAERPRTCTCGSALKYAIMTDPSKITPPIRERLGLLINAYIK